MWRSERCDNLEIMPQLHEEIARVAPPAACPVMGDEGGLMDLWGITKK